MSTRADVHNLLTSVATMANRMGVRFGLVYIERKEGMEQIILIGDVLSRIAVILLDIIDKYDPIFSAVHK